MEDYFEEKREEEDSIEDLENEGEDEPKLAALLPPKDK